LRRRIYLLRHADVAYFDERGRPFEPRTVALSADGEEQARAARDALAGITFDRVVTSGLARTLQTACVVAPRHEPESWPELRELEGGRLADIPDDELERTFTGAFDGVVPLDARFLGGETIGSLLDRVIPAVDRLLAEQDWDTLLAVLHGAVNRAVLSYALTGERVFLGNLEQAPACINVVDVGPGFVVRALNYTPYDPLHAGGRSTTMERLLQQYLPYRKERDEP
jgi:broad specificity phosphatase PhoE